jgi:dienelactone hydrolase
MRRVLPLVICVLFLTPAFAQAQQKRPLDHDAYDSWNSIQGRAVSDDGRWVLYSHDPQEGDSELHVRDLRSNVDHVVPRGETAQFADNGRFVVFLIKPELALVREAQQEDGGRDSVPNDTLGILTLATGDVFKVERVKSFELPEDEGGWVAFLFEEEQAEADSSESGNEERPAAGPSGRAGGRPRGGRRGGGGNGDEKQDGTVLVLRELSSGTELRYEMALEYVFAKNGRHLAYTASSKDSTADGAFLVNVGDENVATMLSGSGDYKAPVFDEDGEQVAFLSNRDDYSAEQPSFTLYHYRAGSNAAVGVATEGTSGLPQGWWVSDNGDLSFSDSGERLFFGTAPRPEPEPEEETPEWENVEVDVWNWRDPLLQPNQLVERQSELDRTYQAVVHVADGSVVQLANIEIPTVDVGSKGDADIAVASTNMPYRQRISWDSPGYNDVYLIDVNTGASEMILEELHGRGVELSPDVSYMTWWDGQKEAWFALSVNGGEPINLSSGIPHPVFDESDDHPMIPGSYGSGGWTEDDQLFLVYDKHDVWAVDPTGGQAPRNITEGLGRRENLRFRYVRVDPDEEFLSQGDPILLSAFDLDSKDAGFYRDRVTGDGAPERLVMMPYSFGGGRFGGGVTKAEEADVYLFAKQSFQEFPDLWVSDLSFGNMRKISDANPQQAEYSWGSAELTYWESTDGEPLTGILVKPEGFDPAQKYPMMVYFYETNSDGLHSYSRPFGGGSSVSLSFYASRGYVVFVPDIHYRDGYPGESAFDCVVPGVQSVVAQGFIDRDKIGVQGHSWGGYQIAYLVTKTDIFAAAEAGAPVSNMTSAYGGIRWQTGVSRMMQYERTQSRIGGTLWDKLPLYMENSPLFSAPRVNTPLLMMHNDADGAVPWYQGIEYFVALRRLQKPVWMLNYNGEAHGLRKYPNQKDWQARMQQFYDHYLMGAAAPVWLAEGVPAVQKGKTLGLELVGEQPDTTRSLIP